MWRLWVVLAVSFESPCPGLYIEPSPVSIDAVLVEIYGWFNIYAMTSSRVVGVNRHRGWFVWWCVVFDWYRGHGDVVICTFFVRISAGRTFFVELGEAV